MANKENLVKIRQKIDKIDQKIANLLRKRASEVSKIKALKKTLKLPTIDPKREKEILATFESDYEKVIFQKILQESRKIQEKSVR